MQALPGEQISSGMSGHEGWTSSSRGQGSVVAGADTDSVSSLKGSEFSNLRCM
jgi:hypothetical protein